jgi:hypothetical protein
MEQKNTELQRVLEEPFGIAGLGPIHLFPVANYSRFAGRGHHSAACTSNIGYILNLSNKRINVINGVGRQWAICKSLFCVIQLTRAPRNEIRLICKYYFRNTLNLQQRCGTVTIFYGSGSGSSFVSRP